ncbi:hypothetical protein [Rossellomorea vietnamensis]|uniref:hypothetical protein n=1 Tax=Rossellomorea vietnamensis TaxID=218284 RepID=UPI000554C30D|nr:hypothetical protein [Rossellomorea vietnamensis]
MEFGKRRQVKTRKVHECIGCLKEIGKGSAAVYHTGKTDEEFYKYHLHMECHQFMVKHKEYLDKGVWKGCVHDIRTEEEKLVSFE